MRQVRAFGLFLKYCFLPGGLSLPSGLFSALGALFGGISIISLVGHAFQFSFADALQLVLRWYDKALEFLLGWLREPIEVILERLLAFLRLELHIQPHWKHVLVLLNIYFIRNVSAIHVGKQTKRTGMLLPS